MSDESNSQRVLTPFFAIDDRLNKDIARERRQLEADLATIQTELLDARRKFKQLEREAAGAPGERLIRKALQDLSLLESKERDLRSRIDVWQQTLGHMISDATQDDLMRSVDQRVKN